MRQGLALLRTILFTIVFYAGSVPLVSWGALVAPFSRSWLFALCSTWSRWFRWCARVFLGIRLTVIGDVPGGSTLVAIKHQSAFEAILTLSLFHRPAVVMKSELRRIPVWGFTSERHGSIFVNRSGSASTLRTMLRAGQAAAAQGRPVVIFPEGTRVPVGETPPLGAGFAGLYKLLKLPVVPVALNSGLIWPRSFIKHPGTVTVRFLPEIPVGLSRDAVEARVHAAINLDPVTGR